MYRPDMLLQNVINGSGLPNVDNTPSTIEQFVVVGVNVMLGVGFSISIITAAYSAVLFVTSGGDPDRVKTAYRAAMWSIIALGVTIAAVAFKNIVFNLIGANPDLAEINTN